MKIRELFLFCFTMYTKRTCSNLEDGREAPSKARKKGAKRLEFLVIIKSETAILNCICGFSYLELGHSGF